MTCVGRAPAAAPRAPASESPRRRPPPALTPARPPTLLRPQPFGHSNTQASLLSSQLAGFSSVFFGRIDYQDRNLRQNQTNLEMLWRGSASTGASSQTFADAIPGYGPPGGLCYDQNGCGSTTPWQDDPTLEEYNVPQYVDFVVQTAQSFAQNYKKEADGTVNIMWTMGSDFQYVNAEHWYKNLDRMIAYTNVNTSTHGVNLFYSHPAEYTATKLSSNLSWSVKTDDFFPYCDGPHACWTGYFTSRPALKGYVRDTSSVMQGSKQIQLFGAPPADTGKSNYLYRLERALGVTQHHDSVSGTSKQHVAYDYARRLAWGREDAAAGNKLALQALTRFKGDFATCDLSNATICAALEKPVAGQSVLVLVWNQQAQGAAALPVRIPAMLANGVASFSVQGPDGADVVAQLVPASGADLSLRVGYYGVPAASELVWVAFQAPVPALGFAAYFLTAKASAAEAPRTHVSVPRAFATGPKALRAQDATITNGVVTLTISAATGMLSNYADSSEGISLSLQQSYFYYNSSNGMDAPNDGTSDYNQASGAYIFRTNSSTNCESWIPPGTPRPSNTIDSQIL